MNKSGKKEKKMSVLKITKENFETEVIENPYNSDQCIIKTYMDDVENAIALLEEFLCTIHTDTDLNPFS